MKPILLATLVALAPLGAGCLGYPPDAARVGDQVFVRYDAVDLETGATVAVGNVTRITLGAGISPLGLDVEHALIGQRENETFTVESRDDPGRSFSQTRSVPSELRRAKAEFTAPTDVFRQQLGEPVVGQTHEAEEFLILVLATNETETRARYQVRNVSNPLPAFGVEFYWSAEGEDIVERFRPSATPAVFRWPEPRAPFHDPGTYRARAVDGTNVTFDYSPILDDALFERDVRFTVTVLDVERGPRPTEAPTGIGDRLSPQAGRHPQRMALTSAPAT